MPPGVLTISAGVASYEPGSTFTSAEILDCADRALYTAKTKGRNRVTAFADEQLVMSEPT